MQNQPVSGIHSLGGDIHPFIIGALILGGLICAVLASIVLINKRLLPPLPILLPTLLQNLPPSGAPPWQRTRPQSMPGNGNTTLYDSGIGTSVFSGTGNGYPPPMPGFSNMLTSISPQSQGIADDTSGFPANGTASDNTSAVTGGFSPITPDGQHQQATLTMPPDSLPPAARPLDDEQAQTGRRIVTRLVKLEAKEHNSSGALPIVANM